MPASFMATPGMQPMPQVGAAGRPQPQTTNDPTGGPFLRHARWASRPGYNLGSSNFGSQITNPLSAAPGYLRYLDFTINTTGSTSTAAVVATADAPFSAVSLIQLKDPWGTPLITGDGFSLLYLLHKYSGQGFGSLFPAADIKQLPSFTAVQLTSGAGAGQFQFRSCIPLEGTKGYGVVSIGNSSVLPSLTMQLGASSSVYTTPPSTLPTATPVNVDEFYYDIDPSYPVEPPGNGSTFQTAVVTGNQSVGANSSTRVALPRTGGYLTNVILVARDSLNARIDIWNSTGRIRFYIDGVPRFDETFLQAQDRMFSQQEGVARDTGVIAYSFKTSLNQSNLGLLDTLEQALQTNPGTLLEVEMTPWGSGGTGPYQIQAIITQLVPSGPIAQGLPEV